MLNMVLYEVGKRRTLALIVDCDNATPRIVTGLPAEIGNYSTPVSGRQRFPGSFRI